MIRAPRQGRAVSPAAGATGVAADTGAMCVGCARRPSPWARGPDESSAGSIDDA